jgi:hypothetical protein
MSFAHSTFTLLTCTGKRHLFATSAFALSTHHLVPAVVSPGDAVTGVINLQHTRPEKRTRVCLRCIVHVMSLSGASLSTVQRPQVEQWRMEACPATSRCNAGVAVEVVQYG